MTDVTAAYRAALAGRSGTEAEAAEFLADKEVLLVRGFLSDAVVEIGAALSGPPRIPPLESPTGIGQYFDDQMRWLDARHIRHERVEIESEASVHFNARLIRKRIAASERRVVIVSHSKGCLDVLDALVSDGALSARIARWVAIQGPFRGTPVADVVSTAPGLRGLAAFVLRAAGGSIDSLDDMRTRSRRDYVTAHAAAITQVLSRIPTVCLATHLTPAQLTTTFLVPTLALIAARSGEHSDGLVPVGSARLGGARLVEIDGVDHAMPVMPSLGSFDRVGSTLALLATLGWT